MSKNTKRIWLNREIIGKEGGQYHIEGSCGHEQIIVAIDPSVIRGLPSHDHEAALLGMIGRIEIAAAAKFAAGESQRVHRYHSPEFSHHLIVLTDLDLLEQS